VSVSKVGGKSASLTGWPNASTNSSARTVRDIDLTPQQEAQAQRIFHALKQTSDADLLPLAPLLAAKPDDQLLDATEFQVRDAVHKIDAPALQSKDYPRYVANGWLIGSGHVEAACKAVVGQRLKGNGRRWGGEGADAVCHLRALFKSEKGRWEAFWGNAA
jgi:hypothetical protein